MEIIMNWNKWIRQSHRWLAIVFTLTVIANFVTMAFGTPPDWIVYAPLLPLFLELLTGLYLFALPYVTKGQGAPRAGLTE
jgi:peptidoglycan/LPS O-acetylase OafA/YrhL